jgi:hypothetical protein
MREKHIDKIRLACIEAAPFVEIVIWVCEGCNTVYGEYVNGCPRCWDEALSREQNLEKHPRRAVTARHRTIHIGDVILGLLVVSRNAILTELFYGDMPRLILQAEDTGERAEWNLRKDDLNEQSGECLEFLANVL